VHVHVLCMCMCMCSACACACCMYSSCACTLHVHVHVNVFACASACAYYLHVHCCALHVLCMCTAYTLCVHCLCTWAACALRVHCARAACSVCSRTSALCRMCPSSDGRCRDAHCNGRWGGRGLEGGQTYSTRRSAISGTPANEGAGDGCTRGFLGAACIAMWEWLGKDCAMLLQPPGPSRRPPMASLQASGFDPV
jgi:hypothetical protein